MLLTAMGAAREKIMETPRSKTIKPKKGHKANTVIVKIRCDYDHTIPEAPEVIGWSATINWRDGGIRNQQLYGGNLLDLVKESQRYIKDKLIDLMGRVQEVDCILKMPNVDHKVTITFKQAMKQLND